MSGVHKRILSPFTVHKKQKALKIYVGTARGSYYYQEEWLEVFLDDKSPFCNGSESDDSDNADEDYNENIEEVVRRCCSK